jgi:hypothetical protein
MTTSGTYTYDPSLGELTLFAFNLCQLRNTSLTQEHMQSARTATNLMLATWANQGVNLWAVDLITTPVVQGQATYTVDSNTVMILDAYMVTPDSGSNIDRVILPVSRSEYATYPNKEQQGFPTVYWFDRLINPTVTLWPVPDGVQTTELKYYRVRRLQDAEFTGGQTVEIPYLWLEAFADGLAYRLAKVWNPQLAPGLKAAADETYKIAAEQNIEQASQFISPQIFGYYRP